MPVSLWLNLRQRQDTLRAIGIDHWAFTLVENLLRDVVDKRVFAKSPRRQHHTLQLAVGHRVLQGLVVLNGALCVLHPNVDDNVQTEPAFHIHRLHHLHRAHRYSDNRRHRLQHLVVHGTTLLHAFLHTITRHIHGDHNAILCLAQRLFQRERQHRDHNRDERERHRRQHNHVLRVKNRLARQTKRRRLEHNLRRILKQDHTPNTSRVVVAHLLLGETHVEILQLENVRVEQCYRRKRTAAEQRQRQQHH
mmetsp:Transcript_34448/g.56054  ORF Transcript_34448/g.56054 Transcript_34448/m.56054 type:complete len:250 (-) Transcript_34448:679-1428(-)